MCTLSFLRNLALRELLRYEKLKNPVLKQSGIASVYLFMGYKINKIQHVNKCLYVTKIEPKKIGSKYCPISALEHTEIRMRDLLFDEKSLSVDEWRELKKKLLLDFLTLTELNFDSILMNVLLTTDNMELAISFMNYLKAIGHKPNLVTCMKYMALCSKHHSDEYQKRILETFELIKNVVDSTPVLNHSSVNYIVQGLCATDQWRIAFNYLDKLPKRDPLVSTTNALVSGALRNDEEEIAWDILTSSYPPSGSPDTDVIKEYFLYARRCLFKNLYLADKNLAKFLLYLRLKSVIIKKSCLNDLKAYFESHPRNWIVSNSKINRLGFCNGCRNTLDRAYLTKNEFQQLEKAFFNKVVNKSDVFLNSTRHEMNSFLRYVEHRKPFDIIIDGLNAAYSFQEVNFKGCLAKQLLNVVKGLSVTSPRILVLGRKHMYHWPTRIMKEISQKASMFYVSNHSEDDPLTIYAAMASGPDTLFVSCDMMRDHISRLDDPKLIQLFFKWQHSHQVLIAPHEDGTPAFKSPLKHHIAIQGSMKKGWHIPYDDEFILEPYEELNNWLCIQPAG